MLAGPAGIFAFSLPPLSRIIARDRRSDMAKKAKAGCGGKTKKPPCKKK
jgi:hypothetical protein